MTPEEIRRLFQQETEATDGEARLSFEAARTNPEAARALIAILFAMAQEHREITDLLNRFIKAAVTRIVTERAEHDDAFALECGVIITTLMRATERPPRGKPGKTAKTA